MRHVTSRGSAKAFFLDRTAALQLVRAAAEDAVRTFAEVQEILLFGSLADGTHTGLSDIDVAVVLSRSAANVDPLERTRPFHAYFQDRLKVGVDVVTLLENELRDMQSLLANAVTLARRGPAGGRGHSAGR
jgi:predicted nucleotidyltransferase